MNQITIFKLMKTKVLFLVLLTSFSLMFLAGCIDGPCIEGNNMVITEKRIVGSFNSISSESFFDVYIIQDTVDEITVEAESNLMPYIQSWVSGNTLVLREHDNHCLNNSFPIRVTVRVRELSRVYLTGSGIIQGNSEINSTSFLTELSGSGVIDLDVNAQQVDVLVSGSGRIDMVVAADQVNARISGSGEINLSGESEGSNLDISGSGVIRAYGMIQGTCYANISGSGDMYIYVEDYLDVRISGSGSVYYKGTPQVTTHITGSGSVIHQ
jgi:hypothetical protein